MQTKEVTRKRKSNNRQYNTMVKRKKTKTKKQKNKKISIKPYTDNQRVSNTNPLNI